MKILRHLFTAMLNKMQAHKRKSNLRKLARKNIKRKQARLAWRGEAAQVKSDLEHVFRAEAHKTSSSIHDPWLGRELFKSEHEDLFPSIPYNAACRTCHGGRLKLPIDQKTRKEVAAQIRLNKKEHERRLQKREKLEKLFKSIPREAEKGTIYNGKLCIPVDRDIGATFSVKWAPIHPPHRRNSRFPWVDEKDV